MFRIKNFLIDKKSDRIVVAITNEDLRKIDKFINRVLNDKFLILSFRIAKKHTVNDIRLGIVALVNVS